MSTNDVRNRTGGRVTFKAAVTHLRQLAQITREDLAKTLCCSTYLVKQALFRKDAPGYRTPPAGWPQALAKLARERAAELDRFASVVERLNYAGHPPAPDMAAAPPGVVGRSG